MILEYIYLIKEYLNFRLNSKPKGGHGIHSPFVYDLYTQSIDTDQKDNIFNRIEGLRKELLKNRSSIPRAEFGVGSKMVNIPEETIGEIVKKSSIAPYMGRLLFRVANYFNPKSIIELGTSMGISTMYLAGGCKDAKVISIEGDSSLAKIAAENINNLGFNNVTVINGDFDTLIPSIINTVEKLGLVFIDGNHSEEATLRYFKLFSEKADNDTLIIFDDIRWSKGMEKAWKTIYNDLNVSISIDLFTCGLIFFRKGVVKQHFILRYGPF